MMESEKQPNTLSNEELTQVTNSLILCVKTLNITNTRNRDELNDYETLLMQLSNDVREMCTAFETKIQMLENTLGQYEVLFNEYHIKEEEE